MARRVGAEREIRGGTMSWHQITAAVLIALLLAAGWWWENRQDAQGKGDGWLLAVAAGLLLLGALFAFFVLGKAHARDLGQWEGSDPAVRAWYQGLMQPDHPESSCCGEADGYWCDDYRTMGGKAICTIADDRPDEPLGRPHIAVGTVIEIPDYKLKYDRGNPTGHGVVFLSYRLHVFCYVQGGGA